MALSPTIDPSVTQIPDASARNWRKFRRNTLALAGLGVVTAIILIALLAPVLSPYAPDATHISLALHPPSAAHWFGTDNLGRDQLSRVIWGTQESIGAGLLIVLVAAVVGVPIGLISGYAGGIVDEVLMRLTDAALAFPGLVLAMAIAWVLGPSFINAVAALAVVSIPQFARLTRGQAIALREREYVEGARCVGASSVRIMFRHILPNAATPLVVVATLNIGGAILAMSALSFLGLGPPPPAPSWGAMLQAGAEYLNVAPWLSIFPGLAIFVAVLGFNLLGDGIRDIFDPRTN